MHLVGNDLLLIGFELNPKLDFLRVGFQKCIGFFKNVPVHPTIKMLDDTDFNLLLLVVTQFDFKRLFGPLV